MGSPPGGGMPENKFVEMKSGSNLFAFGNRECGTVVGKLKVNMILETFYNNNISYRVLAENI